MLTRVCRRANVVRSPIVERNGHPRDGLAAAVVVDGKGSV
jgi:hypothetical protein